MSSDCRQSGGTYCCNCLVRQAMKKQGLLSEAEQTFLRLERLNLTASQRQDAVNYEAGNVIEFHRRAAGGFKSGEQWKVVERAGTSKLIVEKRRPSQRPGSHTGQQIHRVQGRVDRAFGW